MASEELGNRFEKKRKSSRKFNISILKDVINRNKKQTSGDKKYGSNKASKVRHHSDGSIHQPGSNFCVSPLCINVSGLKTDESTSPPFSPSILGTKQIFTFDDLFPHIRKTATQSPLNTVSSGDHGIYSDGYDIPHDEPLFQQPFYQPIKLSNPIPRRPIHVPSSVFKDTNHQLSRTFAYSPFLERSNCQSSRETFDPNFSFSIPSSPPCQIPGNKIPGLSSPTSHCDQLGNMKFPNLENARTISNLDKNNSFFSTENQCQQQQNYRRYNNNEAIQVYDNLQGDQSEMQINNARLPSLNERHLVLHQRELDGTNSGTRIKCGWQELHEDVPFRNTDAYWKQFVRRRSRRRNIHKQIDSVKKKIDLAKVQQRNFPFSYNCSSSSEESLNLLAASSERIWSDLQEREVLTLQTMKSIKSSLDHSSLMVHNDICRTSKLSSDCLDGSSVSLVRARPVFRDSDFGFRDYDTCDDSDDSDEEGGLDSSDTSSKYGGGLTSNLSLFSSCSTDEEKLIQDFKKYDSDEDNCIDGFKFEKLIEEHCSNCFLLKDLNAFTKDVSSQVFDNKFSMEIVLSLWRQIRKKDKEINKDGDLSFRLQEKKRKLLQQASEDKDSSARLMLRSKYIYPINFQRTKSSLLHLEELNSNDESRTLASLTYTKGLPYQNLQSDELQAGYSSLKDEIVELSNKLEAVSKEKDLYEKSLNSAKLTEAKTEEEHRTSIENLTQQYEERLTELHSVIAELSRKIDHHNDHVIPEEDEEDLEQIQKEKRNSRKKISEEDKKSRSQNSSQELNESTECTTSDSVESEVMFEESELSQMTNTKPQTEASTSCEIDDRAVEAGECIADLDVTECHDRTSNGTDEAVIGCQDYLSTGIEEELRVMREEKNNLGEALAIAQQNIASQRSMLLAMSREREALKKKLKEYQKLQLAIPLSSPQISDAVTVRGLRSSPMSVVLHVAPSDSDCAKKWSPTCSPTLHQDDQNHSDADIQVICKLAERVRLKKAESGDQRVTGSELSSVGIYTTGVAEQLAAGLQEESDAQELFHALATAGGVFAPHERLKEYELEAERLHSRIDHLRAQNDVLGATLNESKAHCDQLALMTGRAEAQAGALKMGVGVLDQIQEAYEVLSALHEAQICLLATTCRAAGLNSGIDLGLPIPKEGNREAEILDELKRAQEHRRTAENVARHLLSRLDKDSSKVMNGSMDATNGCSMGGVERPAIDEEENKIRNCIKRLQGERTLILSCLQGPNDLSPVEEYFPPKYPLTDEEAHKLDLENAVLMQELTAIREDRAELRAQVYLLEREKAGLELRVGTCEAQTAAFSVTIDHLKEELNQSKNITSQESTGDSGAESSSFESESLRREKQLKSRLEDLVVTLEKVTQNSEARHRQSQEFINDLKKANSALLTAVDRLKKKYTLRIKRMELQASNMVERHSQQVKLLKHRILCLEEQTGRKQMSTSLQHSTTSDASF